MNAAQIKKARTLLGKAGITDKEDKEAMVMQFTDGRTTHLSQMTQEETVALFAALSSDEEKKRARMEGKMMVLARDMGWLKAASTGAVSYELRTGMVADVARVNAWAVKHTPYHKPLKELTIAELTKVVSLFEKVYKEFLEKV